MLERNSHLYKAAKSAGVEVGYHHFAKREGERKSVIELPFSLFSCRRGGWGEEWRGQITPG
jgi:hypothetical protein